MQGIRSLSPVIRAIFVIGAVAALVTSITFSVMQSNSVVLADSNFATGTASLQIWDPNTATYGTVAPGFDFDNLIPDVQSSEFTFWLKNDGTVPLTVSGLGTYDSYAGFTDFSQVIFEIRNITTPAGSPFTYSFATLTDATPDALPGNPLDPAEENQYGLKITVGSGSMSGSSANVENFDWTFTGTNP